MQGPVDETDYDIQTNTASAEKGSRKAYIRTESGTCNVCSTPCSSCMHFNQALMGSKSDESSDENCRGNAVSQYSVNDVQPPFKSRTCDNLQNTASEISNLVSANSSHDSFCENAQSQAALDASEDVEMLPSENIVEDHLASEPKCVSDQRSLPNKYDDPKGLEVHDDNISCIIEYKDEKTSYNADRKCSAGSVSSVCQEGFGKTVHFQTASGSHDVSDMKKSHNNSGQVSCYTQDSIQKVPPSLSTPSEVPSLKDIDIGTGSQGSGLPSCNPKVKDLEEDFSSHLKEELPECSMGHMNSSSTKEAALNVVSDEKSAGYDSADTIANSKTSFIGGSSVVSIEVHTDLEVETDKDGKDRPTEALKCVDQDEEVKKCNELPKLPDIEKPSLQSQLVDESDESDVVEHDVKVCDICGDAGREDLLAICSRCSDGAEHTYCMREMLDKVPEGNWMCEECRFEKEIENQKQVKVEMEGTEKNQLSGQANAVNAVNADVLVKLDTKDSDVEGNSTHKVVSGTQVSGKRHAENTEVGPVVKRQAVELSSGSPKSSSPSRIAALSRNGSFKNSDKGKVRPVHQTSSTTHSSDIPETARSPTAGPRLTPRGALLKSNSFSTSNTKPKVKPVEEVLPEKQKRVREPASLDMKEGVSKMMGKSMSFKSSGRLNATESKVKMLSPNFSHVQNPKGLKQAIERNSFDRKNSFKSERTLGSSAMAGSSVSTPKPDQKPASRGESVSLSSISNNRDSKAVQSDGKLTSPKPTCHPSRKGSEIPVTLGEVKRQSSSSTNGTCSSSEQKPNHASLKDEPSSNSWNTEKSVHANETPQDGSPWSRESTNQGEKTRETSVNRPKQSSTTGGRNLPCEKCKEIGHSSQSCTTSSPRPSTVDASAAKSSKELMNKGNKLKAAIEAAMLKRPGIYKRNKVLDQSDEASLSSTDLNGQMASQDQLSISSSTKNMVSAEGMDEGKAIVQNYTVDSSKQTAVNNLKQLSVLPTGSVFSSKVGEVDSIVPADVKPSMRDISSDASTAANVLWKMPVIPEHEYIWQGVFEVHRSGKVPDLCGGVQAHLSTCASPKVLEVANKFPHKVLLNEVPRSSMWPAQFQDCSVKEDNIGLYFFAKDLESYERNYRSLLESMMKNDLALKGNIDGVELLIFPSNQLPEKSQRWNMMFFLWGVFKGRRLNCSEQTSGSSKVVCIPSLNTVPEDDDIPGIAMTSSENTCSPERMAKDVNTCDRSCDVDLSSMAPALVDIPFVSSSETVNGNHNTKTPSCDDKCLGSQEKMEQQETKLDVHFLSRIPTGSSQLCPEVRCTSTSLKERSDPDGKLESKLQPSVPLIKIGSGSNRVEKLPVHRAASLDRQDVLHHPFKMLPIGSQEVGVMRSISEEKLHDRMSSITSRAKFEIVLMDEDRVMDTEADGEGWQFNTKRPRSDPTETVSQPSSTGTSQGLPWNTGNSILVDGESERKKLKTSYSGAFVFNSSRNTSSLSDGFASPINDPAPVVPPINEKRFFPVDLHPVRNFLLGDDSMPRKAFSPEYEDRLHDTVPNLELALGAEKKPSKQGILPWYLGSADKKTEQDKPPDMVTIKEDDDAASLSLSLSFPIPEKERAVKPVPRTEQLLPERPNVNTSFLLFGRGFPDS